METFDRVIEDLFKRRPKRWQGLSEIKRIMKEWGDPHKSYPTVHIAGTNGKGQVAAKVAHALEKGGYKVGRYISPHLHSFEERITINEAPIPKETVIAYDEDLDGLKDGANFFDLVTAMGFRHFSEQEVDIAVCEAGVGGERDSTNVITPLVSIITSIGLDHAEYLGDTLDEVARQKAGIIKRGMPVVLGPNARRGPIFEKIQEMRAPLHSVMRQSCFYDTENQAVASEALKLLQADFPMPRSAVEAGLLYSLPCRFEKRGETIFDVAHNPEGFARLCDALDHLYPNRKFRFVIGMGKTKDHEGSLVNIIPLARHVHFVSANGPDSMPPQELARVFAKLSRCPFTVHDSVLDGVCAAKDALQGDDLITICGSFYIMAEARSSLSPCG